MFSISGQRRPIRRRRHPYIRSVRRARSPSSRAGNPWLAQVAVTVVTAALALICFGVVAVHAQTSGAPTPSSRRPTLPEPNTSTMALPSSTPTTPSGGTGTSTPPRLPDGYSYLNVVSGRPVLVEACQPVAYQVEQAEMPPDGMSVVTEAISMAAQMTGLATTTKGNPVDAGTRITIAYKHESEDSGLAGDAIGVAHVRSNGGLSDNHISRVNISLEIEWFESAIHKRTDLATMVVLHEILHGNGLDHVNDQTSIMYRAARATGPSARDNEAARALNPGCPIRSWSSPTGVATSIIHVPLTLRPDAGQQGQPGDHVRRGWASGSSSSLLLGLSDNSSGVQVGPWSRSGIGRKRCRGHLRPRRALCLSPVGMSARGGRDWKGRSLYLHWSL